VATHETRFEFADKGETGVYKFRFPRSTDPDTLFVWFEYADGGGSLFRTDRPGPYRADENLEPVGHDDLDRLIREHGTTKQRWVEDLIAQYGEWLAWAYP